MLGLERGRGSTLIDRGKGRLGEGTGGGPLIHFIHLIPLHSFIASIHCTARPSQPYIHNVARKGFVWPTPMRTRTTNSSQSSS